MSAYLVTGSSRGTGLELTRQLASKPASEVSIVFATARSRSARQFQELLQENDFEKTLRVNVSGPHVTTRSFLPLLRKGLSKKIINMQTFVNYPAPSYKISKAALNMMTVLYSQSLEEEGFTVICISPGWLKTDMGGSDADLSVESGAEATLNVIIKTDKEGNGRFFNIYVPGWEMNSGLNQYDGAELP
ncbi:NAD(P)-binding protein [Aspergillus ellipticus CBS 707.79]|uniref:NAD(P)-binding protein n=1 Tax=Aspergillus ellipticus CBS 707.79 TaxID=1448320 RepID=A0A319DIQ0_9EURO|nr:NAD(P)-binding protein [Aspergillus ellipticus CBS 707.79]